jgi:hypothetical protein
MIFNNLVKAMGIFYFLISRIVPKFFKKLLLNSNLFARFYQTIKEIRWYLFPKKFYSQFGEDAVILTLFDLHGLVAHKNNFYIDVGAGHPIRGSNTYFLYRLGLRGICIDANNFNVALHKFFRPIDTSINVFIGQRKIVNFWEFSPYEYSTGDSIVAKKLVNAGVKLISKTKKESVPLKEVIGNYFDPNSRFVFLSIDTEGFDFEVLQTNDWDKFRPKFVCIENSNLSEIQNYSTKFEINGIGNYLSTRGYKLIAKIHISEIWLDSIN